MCKFGDPSLNRSRNIPPEAAGSERYFRRLFHYNFRPEVDSDVISVLGVDLRVQFVDFRSNGARYMRGTGFVLNERTNMIEAYPNSAKGVSPKKD